MFYLVFILILLAVIAITAITSYIGDDIYSFLLASGTILFLIYFATKGILAGSSFG